MDDIYAYIRNGLPTFTCLTTVARSLLSVLNGNFEFLITVKTKFQLTFHLILVPYEWV